MEKHLGTMPTGFVVPPGVKLLPSRRCSFKNGGGVRFASYYGEPHNANNAVASVKKHGYVNVGYPPTDSRRLESNRGVML